MTLTATQLETPCVEFKGARLTKGYGRKWRNGKAYLAHRLAWEDAYGPIPDGMWVLHRCDNPPCIEPTHLFLGTAADNNADNINKGRSRRGHPHDRHPSAKLTWETVEQMRAEYAAGDSIQTIRHRHGVSRVLTWRVVTGRAWIRP